MDNLRKEQVPHCERLINILDYSYFACDFSIMGSGKTWTATVVAKERNLSLFVLCPRASIESWKKVAKYINVKVTFITNYESLRSTKGHQPKNPYLYRYDYSSDEDGKEGVEFATTESFSTLVEEGILLVCDESQKLKNDTAQAKAVKALVSNVFQQQSDSRILFISGSPFEEYYHALNFFRLIGFIEQRDLYTYENGVCELLGLNDLMENFEPYVSEDNDPNSLLPSFSLFEKIVNENNPYTDSEKFIFTIFTDIVVPYFTSSMPSPHITYKKDVANGYYRYQEGEKEKEEELIEAIDELKKVFVYDDDKKKQFKMKKLVNMGIITKLLMRIENAKVPLFYRLARQVLERNDKERVIVFLNYTESINTLASLLADYYPIIYDGRLKKGKKEVDAINAFQYGRRRLFIGNLRKGGCSINLHDVKGGEPRTVFINPTFSISDVHQASGRTFRVGMKSDTTIRVVYGNIGDEKMRVLESRILRAMERKSDNLKKLVVTQKEEGVIFPGDYPEYIE